jgi:hypothetical protein
MSRTSHLPFVGDGFLLAYRRFNAGKTPAMATILVKVKLQGRGGAGSTDSVT